MQNVEAIATELIDISDVASMLRVSERTVSRLAKEADFPRPLRIRGCVRWHKDTVLAYICGLASEVSEGAAN